MYIASKNGEMYSEMIKRVPTEILFSGAEEAVESICGLFRSLFREKVPSVKGASDNIIAPGSPKRDGSAFLGVPSSKRSLSTPQGEERTGDPTPTRKIRQVMFTIDSGGGSILLADGVCMVSISKSLHIGSANLW
jgi:hypothetical protein